MLVLFFDALIKGVEMGAYFSKGEQSCIKLPDYFRWVALFPQVGKKKAFLMERISK